MLEALRARRETVLLCVLVLSSAACEGGAGAGATTDAATQATYIAPPASAGRPATMPPGPELFGAFDPAAELASLQGTWKVRDAFGMKTPATWKIDGQALTRSDGEREKFATIEILYPGVLVVSEAASRGAMRTYLSYARGGGKVYIGLGIGGARVGDRYVVADDGVVVFDSRGCRHHRKKMGFGGKVEFEAGVAARCEVVDTGTGKDLVYSLPDRFDTSRLSERRVHIDGDALTDDQLQKDHLATRAASGPP